MHSFSKLLLFPDSALISMLLSPWPLYCSSNILNIQYLRSFAFAIPSAWLLSLSLDLHNLVSHINHISAQMTPSLTILQNISPPLLPIPSSTPLLWKWSRFLWNTSCSFSQVFGNWGQSRIFQYFCLTFALLWFFPRVNRNAWQELQGMCWGIHFYSVFRPLKLLLPNPRFPRILV